MCKPNNGLDDDGNLLPLPRGVFEERSVPADYRHLRMIAADGTELVNLRFHRRAENRDLVVELRRWLADVDPAPPKLALVLGGIRGGIVEKPTRVPLP